MDVEAELSRLLSAGKRGEAAALTIETYGPSLLGFLASVLADRVDARDAFAEACEDLWKGLPRFAGRSTVKTWFYTLGRNAAFRMRNSPFTKRRVPLSEISEVIDQVSSHTPLHVRPAVKAKLDEIRRELEESDRTLLILRVDRDMSWNDVARVMSKPDASDEELARESARLRQRFQTIKKIIRARARGAGLFDDPLEPNAES